MLNLGDTAEVFLIPGITDMRKGIDRLSILVSEKTKANVFSGAYFLFCNRHRDTIKILYWDRNGFCLWQKRLDKEKFWWPKNEDDVKRMEAQEIRWIIDGLDPTKITGHKKLTYSTIC